MKLAWMSFIIRYTVEDSFIVGKKIWIWQKVEGGELRSWKALDIKSGGGVSSLGALQKFTPMEMSAWHSQSKRLIQFLWTGRCSRIRTLENATHKQACSHNTHTLYHLELQLSSLAS